MYWNKFFPCLIIAWVLLLSTFQTSALVAGSPNSQTKSLRLTFYGYPNNDPPGDAIAYPKIHQVAGGTGTYDDPVTVAILTERNGGNWTPGTRMYVPSLKKYLIVENECTSCVPDQIDVWMDSTADNPDAVLQCQKNWTPEELIGVEFDPPDGREVLSTPFFDIQSGQCGSFPR